jgi:hypothetical protein
MPTLKTIFLFGQKHIYKNATWEQKIQKRKKKVNIKVDLIKNTQKSQKIDPSIRLKNKNTKKTRNDQKKNHSLEKKKKKLKKKKKKTPHPPVVFFL